MEEAEEEETKVETPDHQPQFELPEEDPAEKTERRASLVLQRESMRQKRRGTFGAEKVDRTSPHVVLMHEDPQMSGVLCYSLANGVIHIGRKNGDPVPEIILPSIGIKPNHAKITLLENGLFEFTVCDADAALNTMVNGKTLPKKRSRILNHLDRIAFAGGMIYIFHYPLLSRVQKKIVEQNATENEGMDSNLQLDQAWANI